MGLKEIFTNFKRNFCNYEEYENKIEDIYKISLKNANEREQQELIEKEKQISKLREERDIYYKKSEYLLEDLNNAELTPVDKYCKLKGYPINNFIYKDKIIIGDVKIPCNLREMITPMSYVVEKVRKSIAKTDIKLFWYQRVMNKMNDLMEWTSDYYDNYYYSAYTLTIGKGDCDDFTFAQCSIEPELANAFGFFIDDYNNKLGHSFAVGIVDGVLWIFDAVSNHSLVTEGSNYLINYIITKNNIYVVDDNTNFGDILWQ